MEKRKMRRFDKEFKISVVKMITEAGHSTAEVARSLDNGSLWRVNAFFS